MTHHEPDPLIVTAGFDAATAAQVQALRDRHFPSHLNRVPAHLTLFHHLPGAEQRRVEVDLDEAAAEATVTDFRTRPRFLGRGVALSVEADALLALRARLAKSWAHWLTPQDRQKFQPHVTVQNKVEPAVARALFEAFSAMPPAITGRIVALDLWRYRGGPWEPIRRFDLKGETHK